MKKFLMLVIGCAVAMTASAAQWAVVGSYTTPDWNFDASTKLSPVDDNGNKFSAIIQNLTGDFKIVDIENNVWDTQYGTATPIEIGQTYVLDGKNNDEEPANIKFAGMIQEVHNATVTFDGTSHELTITAADNDIIIGYPTLYFTGSYYNGENWPAPGDPGSYRCDFDEATTTYTVTVNLGNNDEVEFKLVGEGWSNQIGGGVEVETTPVQVELSNVNLKTTLTGYRKLTFNYAEMTMYFSEEVSPLNPGDVLYISGNFLSEDTWTEPGQDENYKGEYDEETNQYTFTVFLGTSGNVEFKLFDESWDGIEIGGLQDDEEIGLEPVKVGFSDKNLHTNLTGYWKLIFDCNNMKMWFSGKAYPTLYITGSFCEWAKPGDEGTIQLLNILPNQPHVYFADVDFGQGTEDVQFKIFDKGWDGLEIGAQSTEDEHTYVGATTPTKVILSDNNLKTSLKGNQGLFFDYDNMEMYFSPDGTTSVQSDIVIENNEPVQYFNLQGIRVENPQNGIFIRVHGSEVTKVIL